MGLTSEVQLTTQQVCAIAGGIHPNTLTRWIDEGLLSPAGGGGRRGAARRFTATHALALAVGNAYREQGASPGRVAGVIRFLAHLRPEVLEKDIAAGRTFPVPSELFGAQWMPGMMVEPPVNDPGLSSGVRLLIHKLDLAAIRARVLKGIAKIAKEAATQAAK
jgi:hypothetical protein